MATTHKDKSVHPLKDTYQSTPAGLVFTALFTEVLATTLDQPLPHPLSQRTAIGCVVLLIVVSDILLIGRVLVLSLLKPIRTIQLKTAKVLHKMFSHVRTKNSKSTRYWCRLQPKSPDEVTWQGTKRLLDL